MMFFKNTKGVFEKLLIGTVRQEGRGRQEGVFSSLDMFFQKVFGREVEPVISPERTLDFAIAH